MKENTNKKSSQIFPLTDAISAYLVIQRASSAVNRTVSKKLAQWKLSVAKYGVILQLYDNETLPLSELSKLVFCGNSNLTALVDRMERDDLVKRVNHHSDRRIKEIRLTDKGRELVPKVIAEYRPFLHQMMTCLSPDEQQILIKILTRLRERLEKEP
jgi:MarR family 2-MHQ and catechol resistance regulon transcriptional repressor